MLFPPPPQYNTQRTTPPFRANHLIEIYGIKESQIVQVLTKILGTDRKDSGRRKS